MGWLIWPSGALHVKWPAVRHAPQHPGCAPEEAEELTVKPNNPPPPPAPFSSTVPWRPSPKEDEELAVLEGEGCRGVDLGVGLGGEHCGRGGGQAGSILQARRRPQGASGASGLRRGQQAAAGVPRHTQRHSTHCSGQRKGQQAAAGVPQHAVPGAARGAP